MTFRACLPSRSVGTQLRAPSKRRLTLRCGMLLAILVSTTPVRPLTGTALTGTAPVVMRFDDRPKPGDWTCPDCGINVFARKQVCFRCGAQRPGSRGGFGSGGNRPDAPYMRTSRNPNPNEPYMREPGDTNDEIDVPLVEMMVLERAALRAKGDFGAADAVRDELALMGVTVSHARPAEAAEPAAQAQARPPTPPTPPSPYSPSPCVGARPRTALVLE